MNTDEFIATWREMKDADGTPSVGIGIYWDNIQTQNSKVHQFYGAEAWEKIGLFYTPVWGNFRRTTLKQWLDQSRSDYLQFVDEEKVKIEFYDKNGMVYPLFCAFADESGEIGVLGDGSHRYIDCNYLIFKGKDLSNDIKNCRLDVLCVPDLAAILSSLDVPPGYSRSQIKMNQINALPQELHKALKLVIQIFDQNKIKYWLGGGLLQLIIQNKYDSITKNYRNHDIDLHILSSQKTAAYKALKSCQDIKELGIYSSGFREIKIAFKVRELCIETPFLFDSPDDANVVFFVSWGKKEDWPLSENERQKFYYYSLTKEIFSDDKIELKGLRIQVPKTEYVKILYK